MRKQERSYGSVSAYGELTPTDVFFHANVWDELTRFEDAAQERN